MPGPYTLAQLRTQVLRELQDPNGVYFSIGLVNDLINEGVAMFLENTRLRRETVLLNVQSGISEIDLSVVEPTILEVTRVALPRTSGGTDTRELRYLTQEEVEGMDPYWQQETGDPIGYTRWQDGWQGLTLYPTPMTDWTANLLVNSINYDSGFGMIEDFESSPTSMTSAYGLVDFTNEYYGALTVDFIAGATAMTLDTHTPWSVSKLPAQFHDSPRKYAVGRCLQMETAVKQWQRGQSYLAEFGNDIERAKSTVHKDFQAKPPRAVKVREF